VGISLAPARAASAPPSQKVVSGKVIGTGNQPLSEAIVYLKNGKTTDIKSFISAKDGTYRFGQLSPDVDYEIWAEFQGKKSPTKSISSFDSRKQLNYELKVDTGK
jgi:hypothetical protein